jgi:hypothetical protein
MDEANAIPVVLMVTGAILLLGYSRKRFYNRKQANASYVHWLKGVFCEKLFFWLGGLCLCAGLGYIAFSNNSLVSWLALSVLVMVGKAMDAADNKNKT